MESVHLLIKPASGLCDLRCSYCFYRDEMQNRAQASRGVMATGLLETVVRRVFDEAERSCAFSFQGGEPTLAGLAFYRRFIALLEQWNTRSIPIQLAIQTNGCSLDEEWAEFLARNHFLVGVSLDGHSDLHNLHRTDPEGGETFGRVMRAVRLLRKHRVEFNILTVVTRQTARHIEKVYRFFQKNGLNYQQYIPCLDPLGEPRGQRPWSLTPDLYARFLKSLFDLWYRDLTAGRFVYNRYFENLVGMLMGSPPEACGMAGRCARQIVVEADGSVYPCDFYALDEYCLGNLKTDTLEQIEQKRDETGFIRASEQAAPECGTCRWYPLCRGGCRRDRDMGDGPALNYYCAAYREFFAYSYPRLEAAARSHLLSTEHGLPESLQQK